MKKKIFMLLAMVCYMTGLAACGSSNQEAEIRETVDGFYTASQAGDYSAMRDFVTGDFDALEEFLELGRSVLKRMISRRKQKRRLRTF